MRPDCGARDKGTGAADATTLGLTTVMAGLVPAIHALLE
jgi:hypothetical protein